MDTTLSKLSPEGAISQLQMTMGLLGGIDSNLSLAQGLFVAHLSDESVEYMRPGNLAMRYGFSTAAPTTFFDHLEKFDYTKRENDTVDRRKIFNRPLEKVTDFAVELQRKIDAKRAEDTQQSLDGVPDSEINPLYIQTVAEAVELGTPVVYAGKNNVKAVIPFQSWGKLNELEQLSCDWQFKQLRNQTMNPKLSAEQASVLGYLLDNDNVAMGAVAKYTGNSTAAATGLVDRLEKKGVVERFHGIDDRRKIFARPTDKGNRYISVMGEFCAASLYEHKMNMLILSDT